MDLNNHVSPRYEIQKYLRYQGQFFSKTLKIECRFQKRKTNAAKFLWFSWYLDICIWSGSGKLDLLGR